MKHSNSPVSAQRPLLSVLMIALCVPASSAVGQTLASDDSVQEEGVKQELLAALDGGFPELSYIEIPALNGQVQEPLHSETDGLADGRTARVNDGNMAFYGAGDFALIVDVFEAPSQSFIGYVIEDPDDYYQDMVILDELDSLGTGTQVILAGCSDRHKPFPPNGCRMSTRPRTSSSTSNWKYWARQAAIRGLDGGYSFEDIQRAIWYITDRDGERNGLLRSIGYDSSDPAKNVIVPVGTGGDAGTRCGSGLCGALGVIGPLMAFFGLASFRRLGCFPRQRPTRHRNH